MDYDSPFFVGIVPSCNPLTVLFPFQLARVMALMSVMATVEGTELPLEAAEVISIYSAREAHSSPTAGSWFDLRHGSGGDFWSEV